MDLHIINRYISEGGVQSRTPHHCFPPHVVIPLCGRFKSEHSESCHLLPLFETKKLVFNIRQVITLLIAVQGDTNSPQVPWVFVGKEGENIPFKEMNDVILKRVDIIKNDYVREREI